MSDRFIVIPRSESAHCCFSATVVDTTRPSGFYNGEQHYEHVCECFDPADAEKIAAALNSAAGVDSVDGGRA
jgi:hypothetical protein